MTITRRSLLAGAALGAAAPLAAAPLAALAQPLSAGTTPPGIRIGLLADMSGPYRDLSGPLSVAAMRQAIVDSGIEAHGVKVELLTGDHQNKPDIGTAIVRQWIDRDNVDMIIDVPNSAVALAVNGVCKEKNKVYINSGAGTADLTGPACSPTTIHWTYDTWMLAHSTGGALVKAGGDSWFFITADYAFGHALERDTANFVKAAGGKVLGEVQTPFPGTTDFSSFLLQAQATNPKVIGLCNAGADTTNCIKQAAEFGITGKGTKLAGLLVFISDVHALGLATAHGLVLTSTFYWDLNDRTRAFTKRMDPHTNGVKLGMDQAGVYSGGLAYLRTVLAMGPVEAKGSGAQTVARMKTMTFDDDAFGTTTIRADGRALHPAYLFEVKTPGESKYAWDYYKLIGTTPADEAFRPLSQGGCPLIHA